jgi:type I restriction enzyme S subunit
MVGVYSFGRGLFHKEPVAGNSTSYKFFYRLKADHVVLSQLFGWEGALALSSREFEGLHVSPQFPTFLCDTNWLDRQFLGWLLRKPSFWADLGTRTKGMGDRRRTVSPDAFLSSTIPLPPLAEQRRIVARIEELAAKVEAARALRQQATEGAEALGGGILAKAYDEAAEIAGGTERLDDLCRQITDGTHSTPTYVMSGVPFLSVKDITTGDIRFDDARFITPEEHEVLRRRCKPEFGDVLLTKVGTTGFAKAIDVHREFSIFVSLALLKLDGERLTPEFTEYMLNSPRLREYSRSGTRGVGNKNLVLKFIREFPMPAPPLEEQHRIVAYLDALLAKVDAVKAHQAATAAALDALLPSILDQAFKGEL